MKINLVYLIVNGFIAIGILYFLKQNHFAFLFAKLRNGLAMQPVQFFKIATKTSSMPFLNILKIEPANTNEEPPNPLIPDAEGINSQRVSPPVVGPHLTEELDGKKEMTKNEEPAEEVTKKEMEEEDT